MCLMDKEVAVEVGTLIDRTSVMISKKAEYSNMNRLGKIYLVEVVQMNLVNQVEVHEFHPRKNLGYQKLEAQNHS